MRQVKLPETRMPSGETAEAFLAVLFPVLLAASLVAVVIIGEFSDIGWYRAFPVMGLPLVAAGVIGLAVAGRWPALAAVALVTLALYFAGLYWAVGFLTFSAGSVGAAVMAAVAQRRLFRRTLEALGRGSSSAKPSPADRLALFMFDAPSGTDLRDPQMADALTRSRMPYREALGTFVLALAPCLLACAFMMLLLGFRLDVPGAEASVMTAAVLCAAAALPWATFGSLDVRAGGFRLYGGVTSSAVRVSATLVLVMVLEALVLPLNWRLAGMIALMLALAAASVFASSMAYHVWMERRVASDVVGEWRAAHPVRMDGPVEERPPHPLRDGVPGTPMRQDDACLSDQKY